MIDRVRTIDQMRPASMVGVSYLPSAPRDLSLSVVPYIGYKKTIVDKIATRVSCRVRMRNRDKVWPPVRAKRKVTDLKPVRIQSFKGYGTNVTIDTRGYTKSSWTQYVVTGPLALCLMRTLPTTLYGGKTWTDLTRSPVVDADATSWALQCAYSNRAQPDAELSVALAQLPQLFALLHSPIKALQKSAKVLRDYWASDSWVYDPKFGLLSLKTKQTHPGKKVTQKFLDEASNRWLEFQYGVLPTLSDAEVVMDAIDDVLEPIRDIMYGKSKYTAYSETKVFRDLYSPVTPFTAYGKAVYTGKIKYTSKCYYRYKDIPVFLERTGFRPQDIWNFLWELLPWSFVVDWLWNIGDLLHRLSYEHLLEPLGNYVSVKYDQKMVLQSEPYVTQSTYKILLPSSRLYLHQEELLRQVNLEVPVLPQFNVKWFNVTRSLNALSLLWQNLPK